MFEKRLFVAVIQCANSSRRRSVRGSAELANGAVNFSKANQNSSVSFICVFTENGIQQHHLRHPHFKEELASTRPYTETEAKLCHLSLSLSLSLSPSLELVLFDLISLLVKRKRKEKNHKKKRDAERTAHLSEGCDVLTSTPIQHREEKRQGATAFYRQTTSLLLCLSPSPLPPHLMLRHPCTQVAEQDVYRGNATRRVRSLSVSLSSSPPNDDDFLSIVDCTLNQPSLSPLSLSLSFNMKGFTTIL
eukprot:gene8975-6298_t